MVGERLVRNIGTISEGEQARLASATVGVVGLGGIGAPAFESLVRLGVGNFVIFDRDVFEESNFNRQIYATEASIGKNKAEVAAEKAREINPKVMVGAHAKALDAGAVGLLKGCSVVVDGTDNIATRGIIASYCRKKGIPYVFCSAGGSMGMCAVFTDADFSKVFGTAKEVERKHVIAPAAFMAGAISASQAAAVLLGKKFVKAPEFIFFDVFSEKLFWRRRI